MRLALHLPDRAVQGAFGGGSGGEKHQQTRVEHAAVVAQGHIGQEAAEHVGGFGADELGDEVERLGDLLVVLPQQ